MPASAVDVEFLQKDVAAVVFRCTCRSASRFRIELLRGDVAAVFFRCTCRPAGRFRIELLQGDLPTESIDVAVAWSSSAARGL